MKEIEHTSGLSDVPAGTEEVLDPMSPEYAPGLSLIVLMRIYDVQMALLAESNPERAEALARLHANGGVLSAMPWIDSELVN